MFRVLCSEILEAEEQHFVTKPPATRFDLTCPQNGCKATVPLTAGSEWVPSSDVFAPHTQSISSIKRYDTSIETSECCRIIADTASEIFQTISTATQRCKQSNTKILTVGMRKKSRRNIQDYVLRGQCALQERVCLSH